MSHLLSVSLHAPLRLGNLVACVTLEDGQSVHVLLVEGAFFGEVPAKPVHLQLTTLPEHDANVAGTGQAMLPSSSAAVSFAIEDLYEKGTAVPVSGQLALSLFWGVHCHRELSLLAQPSDGRSGATAQSLRFGSFEHMVAAERVGLGDDGLPLAFRGIQASFDRETFLLVGGKKLTFGEIVALAGDYYAHFDAQAAQEFAWAWPDPVELTGLLDTEYRRPTLVDDEPQTVTDILQAVDATKQGGQAELDKKSTMVDLALSTSYPLRRYLALASQNHCHFASQPWNGQIDDRENAALRLYIAYHNRAMRQAETSGANKDVDGFFHALSVDAFGCHFLSDLFATGHIRTPRRILGEKYGVAKGALGMSHEMHCEDNKLGMWLTTRSNTSPRMVWRGYGDDQLLKPQAANHLWIVQRAVARSAAEVFAAYCGERIPAESSAMALIPVPLPAGQTPQPGDVLPDGSPAPQTDPNSYPLFCWLSESQFVARRTGRPSANEYVNQDKGNTKFSLS